ncbi:hypothetical protein HN011_011572, partial [Eciton burchellii]
REVKLSELRDSIARLRERVKLVCRTRGSPPPRVHWLKDGVPLHPRRGLRIQHKRRRSKVVISSAKPEDSGRYECVAESTSGHRASLAAQLLVAHDTRIPETKCWTKVLDQLRGDVPKEHNNALIMAPGNKVDSQLIGGELAVKGVPGNDEVIDVAERRASRVGKACGSPPSGSASSYDGQRTTITTPAATSGFHTVLLMAARRQNVSVIPR